MLSSFLINWHEITTRADKGDPKGVILPPRASGIVGGRVRAWNVAGWSAVQPTLKAGHNWAHRPLLLFGKFKTVAGAMNSFDIAGVIRFRFDLFPQAAPRSSHHQAPSFCPHHQISPTVAVFCCLLKSPWMSDKNEGRLE